MSAPSSQRGSEAATGGTLSPPLTGPATPPTPTAGSAVPQPVTHASLAQAQLAGPIAVPAPVPAAAGDDDLRVVDDDEL